MKPILLLLFALFGVVGCNEPALQMPTLSGIFDDAGFNQPAPQPYPYAQPVYPQPQPAPYVYPQPQPFNPDCPDGRCPYQSTQSNEGVEVRTNGESVHVNTAATDETKGGCPTGDCPLTQSRPVPTYQLTSTPVTTRSTQRGTTRWVRVDNGPPIPLGPGEVFSGFTNTPQMSTTRAPYRNRPTMPPPERDPLMHAPAPASAPYGQLASPNDDGKRQGAFACMRCGRPTVGSAWHELWADDGTPLTCVCEQCWQQMNSAQREATLRSYVAQTQGGRNLSTVVNSAIRSESKTGTEPRRAKADQYAPQFGTEL